MTNLQTAASVGSETNSEVYEQHSIPQSILYHLLPGAFILLVFGVLTQVLGQYNLPSSLLFIGALPLGLIPAELGLMYYLGWKRNGRLSLDGIVLYRESIKTKHYFWLVPVIFVITIVLFVVVSSFSEPIYRMFDWLPAWMSLETDLTAYSKNTLLFTQILLIIGAGIFAPIVEEFYFRGFLLPRLSRFGKWAPPIESALFAIYHFWSPAQIVERTIGMLPMAYFAQYKRNIYVGVIVHCAINTIGSLPLLLAILEL